MSSLPGLTKQTSIAEPVSIISDSDLKKEFDKFAIILSDNKKDFKARVLALKRLQGIIIGGGCERKSFWKLFMNFRPQMTTQILDLRDKVCKNACKVLILLAEHAPNRFKTYAHQFVTDTALFQLISVPTFRVHYGHNCIFFIVQHIQSSKLLLKVLEGINTKNVNVRERTTEYILVLLREYPPTMLDKNALDLEECIKKMLTDSNQSVRENARICYQEYISKLPDRESVLFGTLDPKSKKYLEKLQKVIQTETTEEEEKGEPIVHNESSDSVGRSGTEEENLQGVLKEIFNDFDQKYTRGSTIMVHVHSPQKNDRTIFLSDDEGSDSEIPDEHLEVPGVQTSLVTKLSTFELSDVLYAMARATKRESGEKLTVALNLLRHFLNHASWQHVQPLVKGLHIVNWLVENAQTGSQTTQCLEQIWLLLGQDLEKATKLDHNLVILHVKMGRDLVDALKHH